MVEGQAKYRPYPTYKPSGVEWLGDIPEGWRLQPCRANVNHHMDKNSNGKSDNYLSLMANVGIIPYADKGDVGNKKPDDLSKCKIVRAGDLVINSMNYAIGSYGMSPYDGICSPVYIVLSAKPEKLLNRFALRVFENKPFQKHLAAFGNGILEHRAAIGWDTIKGQYMPVPPLNEQEIILSFLDHETAKIDALIAKQERMIELLEEKHQAVISHAVTKGLDPTAPLRPSGIDWLGDIPAHWELMKFSHCTSIRSGQVDPRKSPFNEYILIAPNHIQSGTGKLIAMETAAEQGADSGKYLCAKGEVIYSKIRPALAKACLAPSDHTICSADMYPIAGGEGLSNQFLFWNLLSEWFTALTILESDRVAMPKINREKLAEVCLPIPPVREQEDICQSIQSRINTLDKLTAKAQSAITLLKERRTALISAAVTGKIDLRDWQAPESIQPPSTRDINQPEEALA